MNYLPELIECLRPESDTNAMLKAQEQIQEDENSCDYCKSYNGEKPTAKFTLKDHFTGLIEIIDLCDDCQNEDHIFRNKTVLRIFKL
jgi:hypothetical protein